MFSDEKYKACYELYKDAEEALEESDLDMLEKLTLQYHVMKDTPVSLTEVLHRRMEGLKEGNRELRVYIAGKPLFNDKKTKYPQCLTNPPPPFHANWLRPVGVVDN